MASSSEFPDLDMFNIETFFGQQDDGCNQKFYPDQEKENQREENLEEEDASLFLDGLWADNGTISSPMFRQKSVKMSDQCNASSSSKPALSESTSFNRCSSSSSSIQKSELVDPCCAGMKRRQEDDHSVLIPLRPVCLTLPLSSKLQNVEFCLNCGCPGEEDLVICVHCGEAFHSFCVYKNKNLLISSRSACRWQCPKCKICSFCREHIGLNEKDCLTCKRCDACVHKRCFDDDVVVEESSWICKLCTFCIECGETDPESFKWKNNCDICGKCYLKKQQHRCSTCLQVLQDKDLKNLIFCSKCQELSHVHCQGWSPKTKDALYMLKGNLESVCNHCCENNPMFIKGILKQLFTDNTTTTKKIRQIKVSLNVQKFEELADDRVDKALLVLGSGVVKSFKEIWNNREQYQSVAQLAKDVFLCWTIWSEKQEKIIEIGNLRSVFLKLFHILNDHLPAQELWNILIECDDLVQTALKQYNEQQQQQQPRRQRRDTNQDDDAGASSSVNSSNDLGFVKKYRSYLASLKTHKKLEHPQPPMLYTLSNHFPVGWHETIEEREKLIASNCLEVDCGVGPGVTDKELQHISDIECHFCHVNGNCAVGGRLMCCCCCCLDDDGDGDSDNDHINHIDDDVWVHVGCAIWSSNVRVVDDKITGLGLAIKNAQSTICDLCLSPGASLHCHHPTCLRRFHLLCALSSKQCFFASPGTFACSVHRRMLMVGSCHNDDNAIEVHRSQLVNIHPNLPVYPVKVSPFCTNSGLFLRENANTAVYTRLGMDIVSKKKILRSGSLTLTSLGQYVPSHWSYHTKDMLFPVGYHSVRLHWSRKRDGIIQREAFQCSIEEGKLNINFKVQVKDRIHQNASALVSWVNATNGGDIAEKIPYLTPYHLMGISVGCVAPLLEYVSGSEHCKNYHQGFQLCKYEPYVVNNSSGCIKTQPYEKKHHRSKDVLDAIGSKSPNYDNNNNNNNNNDDGAPLKKKSVNRTVASAEIRPSVIHSHGLFAIRPIKAQELIIHYVGEIVSNRVADKREISYERKGIGCYMFRLDQDYVIDATLCGNAARYINHCCQPNSFASLIDGKEIAIFAKRNIDANEEITYDYQLPIEENKIPCNCGAPLCRKYLN